MCTEAEKKEYVFSPGGKVNFTGQCHFTDALADEDTSTKEMIDHEFSTYSKICCSCDGTTSNANLSTSFAALETRDQHVSDPGAHVSYQGS